MPGDVHASSSNQRPSASLHSRASSSAPRERDRAREQTLPNIAEHARFDARTLTRGEILARTIHAEPKLKDGSSYEGKRPVYAVDDSLAARLVKSGDATPRDLQRMAFDLRGRRERLTFLSDETLLAATVEGENFACFRYVLDEGEFDAETLRRCADLCARSGHWHFARYLMDRHDVFFDDTTYRSAIDGNQSGFALELVRHQVEFGKRTFAVLVDFFTDAWRSRQSSNEISLECVRKMRAYFTKNLSHLVDEGYDDFKDEINVDVPFDSGYDGAWKEDASAEEVWGDLMRQEKDLEELYAANGRVHDWCQARKMLRQRFAEDVEAMNRRWS
ncbi:hypothetical protein BE221DRAFT_77883 [Ostreococcus tauri]|uniref:Uncharacterized protein n=1 Tax=Ostreococcus tauri TaxID=70448 RepID=A0A1Y5I9Z3_OSTTA|nr:hypothetical protein BE221DRAFT_77883 [Ostreococcus tauri]